MKSKIALWAAVRVGQERVLISSRLRVEKNASARALA